MQVILIILGYTKWHYTKAVYSLSEIWKNFLNFVYIYFSIKTLFVNFFEPWKRMADEYPKKFDLQIYFNTFITNSIMRVVGIIMRISLIIMGLICYLLLLVLYPVIMIIWIFLPIIALILIGTGIILIIK